MSDKIHDLLTECRVKLNANRVVVVRFHNGGNYTNSNPMLKFSIVYESTDSSTKEIMNLFQNVFVSKYPKASKLLFDQGYLKIDDVKKMFKEKPEYIPNLYSDLLYHNVKAYYEVAIKDVSNYIVGFIAIAYHYQYQLSEGEFQRLEEHATKLGNLIDKE